MMAVVSDRRGRPDGDGPAGTARRGRPGGDGPAETARRERPGGDGPAGTGKKAQNRGMQSTVTSTSSTAMPPP